MKKFRIRIDYSWGDEEDPIEIEREYEGEAFEYMLDLAMTEVKTSLQEWHAQHTLIIDSTLGRVVLCYGYDNEECYYTLEEI